MVDKIMPNDPILSDLILALDLHLAKVILFGTR